MKNLKDNIWIKGFYKEIDIAYYELAEAIGGGMKDFIYKGKTSDIPEEIAKECVKHIGSLGEGYGGYFDHNSKDWMYHLNTSKESIQSACNQEYCIIFKK